MPTNVSTPIWRCDICRHGFDDDLDAARRCEAAGHPQVLPAGELLLSYDDRGGHRRGFFLQRLYPLPLNRWIGTLAEAHNDQAGHFPFYYVDVDPVPYTDPAGVIRLPPGHRDPRRIEGHWLAPHEPGRLNVIHEAGFGHRGASAGRDGAWIVEALGLAVPDAPADAHPSADWARPLTEPVRAVHDALGARVMPAERERWRLPRGYTWADGEGLGALANEACRNGSGVANKRWARVWLRTRPAPEVVDQVNERWRRWRDGEPGDVPLPKLRCDVRLYASKLNRRMKELVAATGVEWPERTDSDAYVRILIRKALGYKMETTETLFDVPEVIAVTGTKGGVGKSSVAAAVARRIAHDGRRVVLIDCDVTGPSQQLLFKLGAVLTDPALGRVVPSPTDVPGLSVFSPGQLFGPGANIDWDPATVTDWMEFVGSSVDLDDVDVLVLDLPPGEGPVHNVVFDKRRMSTTGSIHVTTAHPLALADTERGLAALDGGRRGWYLRQGGGHLLVENMSRASGTTAGGELVEIRLVGVDGVVRELADRFKLGYGGSMPWCPDVADLAMTDEIGNLAAAVRAEPVTAGAVQ